MQFADLPYDIRYVVWRTLVRSIRRDPWPAKPDFACIRDYVNGYPVHRVRAVSLATIEMIFDAEVRAVGVQFWHFCERLPPAYVIQIPK